MIYNVEELRARIEDAMARPADTAPHGKNDEKLVGQLLSALEDGVVRAAERDDNGRWHAVPWVKQGILLGFRVGQNVDFGVTASGPGGGPLYDRVRRWSFIDKHLFPTRECDPESGVRVVPGGSDRKSVV